jgi:hypothetical protein
MKLIHVIALSIAMSTQAGCSCAGTSTTTLDAGVGDATPDVVHDARHDVAEDARADAEDATTISSTCDSEGLGRGCVSGPCKVTGPSSALPAGATVTVAEIPVPAALAADSLGPTLCSLTVNGAASVPGLTLTLTETKAPPAQTVLFEYVSPSLSQLVVTSQPAATAVEGLVVAPGVYGATVKPGMWSPAGTGGVDVSSSGDQASLLRNLSGQVMSGAFYDGTHLFVCNGPRLLIYNSLPASPSVKPDVVLGQPDLDTFDAETSSSLFGSLACIGLWSDGARLVAGQWSRVLLWDTIPTANLTPADIELGQPDFSSNIGNNGGISATSLLAIADVQSDGTRLVVADRFNNRVLLWSSIPQTLDQPADFVVGQPTFASNTSDNGAAPLSQPEGALLVPDGLLVTGYYGPGLTHIPTISDSNPQSDFTALPLLYSLSPPNTLSLGGRMARTPGGGLMVRDYERVAVLSSLPTGPATISFVLGQPDPTFDVTSPTSASVTATLPAPVGFVEQNIGGGATTLISDLDRLLIFDPPPSYNFEPASQVLGQAGFTTNGQVDYRGISLSTLAGPADVAVSGATLAVADRGNNRVLLYATGGLAPQNTSATVVVGQPDAASYIPNLDQQTPSAARLSGPAGVALDGTHLIVADSENHRVLIWNTVPTASGAAADLVLGQADFTSRRPNHGNGDGNADGFSDADASGFFYPMGVASDGVHLFVVDRMNNRVLVWNTFPTTSGQPADAVLGQASFTDVMANANQGGYATAANGLNLPIGICLSGTSLYVADSENNRVVRWDTVTTTPTPAAFLGQTSGTTVANPNYNPLGGGNVGLPTSPATTALSSLHPRGIAVAGGIVFVSEVDSSRVHMFDATALTPQGELGQTSPTVGTPNTNGVGAGSLSAPWGVAGDGTHLWVADGANNRVVGYPSAGVTTGALATTVIGQSTMLVGGFNQTSTAAGGATSQPHGMTYAAGQLYVADSNNNRVTVFAGPLSSGEAPTAVYGQPNGTLSLPNSGGTPSAGTLSGPRGVFADASHVIVADTENNRVLVYDATTAAGDATLVLGQSSFSASAVAGTQSASSLQTPQGVFSDGTSLWVADTGNNRILVWKTFPTANGQAADLVLGQTSFVDVLPNMGSSAAAATTLAFPSDVASVGGVLYVADSGNNRLIYFTTAPAAPGAAADGVLGQVDLTGRTAATDPEDLTQLAGPVKLAADVENLYVADRDLARVVVYGVGVLRSGEAAARAIGAAGGLSIQSPGGVAVSMTPFFTSVLYASDAAASKIDIVAGVSRLGGD